MGRTYEAHEIKINEEGHDRYVSGFTKHDGLSLRKDDPLYGQPFYSVRFSCRKCPEIVSVPVRIDFEGICATRLV